MINNTYYWSNCLVDEVLPLVCSFLPHSLSFCFPSLYSGHWLGMLCVDWPGCKCWWTSKGHGVCSCKLVTYHIFGNREVPWCSNVCDNSPQASHGFWPLPVPPLHWVRLRVRAKGGVAGLISAYFLQLTTDSKFLVHVFWNPRLGGSMDRFPCLGARVWFHYWEKHLCCNSLSHFLW